MGNELGVGDHVHGREGYRYRSIERPREAVGPDRSTQDHPFGWLAAYELELVPRQGEAIPHHPGATRGPVWAQDVVRVFYLPGHWSDEVVGGRVAADLEDMKHIFPNAMFYEIDTPEDAEDEDLDKVVVSVGTADWELGESCPRCQGPLHFHLRDPDDELNDSNYFCGQCGNLGEADSV